jgi:hypothetical protein
MLRNKRVPFIDEGIKKNVSVFEEQQRSKLNRSSVLKGNARFPTIATRTNDSAMLISDAAAPPLKEQTLKEVLKTISNRSVARKRNSFQRQTQLSTLRSRILVADEAQRFLPCNPSQAKTSISRIIEYDFQNDPDAPKSLLSPSKILSNA